MSVASAEILRIKPARKPRATRTAFRPASRPARASLGQRVAAGAAVSLEVLLTALSLSHQAVGVGIIVVSATEWERWSMAAGIDCTYLVCRAAMLCAPDGEARRNVARWALPTQLAAMAISAGQNALANTRGLSPHEWQFWAAAGLGLVMPAAICALGQVAHAVLSGRGGVR